MGIDPGYGIIGFAFLKVSKNCYETLNYGVIRTLVKLSFVQRLEVISRDLDKLIKKYKPDVAGVEQIYFAKNAKTAINVGQARGVILLKLIENKVPVREFTPLQVKQALTSYGRADKKQMQAIVKMILGLRETPKPDDAADALAIAITTAQTR